MRYHWEHAEVTKLATDLSLVPADVDGDLRRVVKTATVRLKDIWVANATVSAGKHGKLYPLTIKAKVKGLEGEVKPDASMPQGGMNFEYGGPSIIRRPDPGGEGGSAGQPVGQTRPHLDMNRAADIVFPWFHQQVADEAEIPL